MQGKGTPIDLVYVAQQATIERTEEHQSNDLRFLDGVLQRRFSIITFRGFEPSTSVDEWRPIPSVTTAFAGEQEANRQALKGAAPVDATKTE